MPKKTRKNSRRDGNQVSFSGRVLRQISLSTTLVEVGASDLLVLPGLTPIQGFELYRFERLKVVIHPSATNCAFGIVTEDLQTAFTTISQVGSLPHSSFITSGQTIPSMFTVGAKFLVGDNTTKWWKTVVSTNSNVYQSNQFTLQFISDSTQNAYYELFYTIRAAALVTVSPLSPVPDFPTGAPVKGSDDPLSDISNHYRKCISSELQWRGTKAREAYRLCACSSCQADSKLVS